MEIELEQAWRRGFKAGEVFNKHCPYTRESQQARQWNLGWNEGSSKSLGFPYKAWADGAPIPANTPLPLGIAALLDPARLPAKPFRKVGRKAGGSLRSV